MTIQSPLSNISKILNQAKDSAALYGDTLCSNEAATRAALIDPILRALGWNTANADMVEVEKYCNPTRDRADYALHDNNDMICVIIEAKSLGTNLNDPRIDQTLLSYAYAFQPKDMFLTDGLIWKHFTSFQTAKFAPSKTIDLSRDDLTDCAAYLVQCLDAAKHRPDQQTVDTLAQQVIQLQSDLASLQQRVQLLEQSLGGGVTLPPTSPPSDAQYVNLNTLPDLRNTKAKPTSLRLPDGSVLAVKTWRDVLRESCKFAMSKHPAIPIPFHDRAAGRTNLIAVVEPTVPAHTQEQYNGRTVFLYLNYDTNNSVENAVHILKQVPPAAQKVEAAVIYS